MARLDITGERHGRLIAVSMAGKNKFQQSLWLCKCDCGNEVITVGASLRSGNTTSCGCRQRTVNLKHGCATPGTPLNYIYRAYRNARNRCEKPSDKDYRWYGAIGVKWCFESFESFLSEIGERPSPQYTLDRIDSTKHYEPGNVRWADKFTQSLNQRLLRSTNKSGFRCVSQTSNGWSAAISHRGVHYNLGIHPTPELAALAHDQKAKELHGEAARLNFPPKKPSISAESMEMAVAA